MYVLLVRYICKPGLRESYLDAIKAAGIDKMSRDEEGCIRYEYSYGLDSNELILTEVWQDEKAIEFHKNSEHFARLGDLKAQFVEKTEIIKYTAEQFESENKKTGFTTDILNVFDKKWALLTAGNKDSFNTMTVSWGALGTMWGKPAATVYVRKSRYTHEFMENNDHFTVSFYPEECRGILSVMGSKSGRDMDKMHDSGLTAKSVGGSVSFEEAEVTFVCRKLFSQELKPENMLPEIASKFYSGDAVHDMYIGEIVEIIRK